MDAATDEPTSLPGAVTRTEPPSSIEDQPPVGAADFFAVLFGRRDAVLRCVDSRGALVVTALLVLSAAIAREYDGTSLLHRPGELLGPFIASLILASLLYSILQLCLVIAGVKPIKWVTNYRRLLVGYWLTAPLAWLYAIPIESFADEPTSVRFNLTLLSIVSLWRVLLFPRIASIITGISYPIALCWIAFPCCIIAAIALAISSVQITGIMGGLRLTESESIMLEFQRQASQVAWYAGFVFLLGVVGSFIFLSLTTPLIEPPKMRRFRFGFSTWATLGIVFAVFGVGAAIYQPRYFRAAEADQMLLGDEPESTIAYMTSRTESDFPQLWNPPPRGRGDFFTGPRVVRLVEAIEQTEPPLWVCRRLLKRASEILLHQERIWQYSFDYRDSQYFFDHLSDEELQSIREALSRLAASGCLTDDDQILASEALRRIEDEATSRAAAADEAA